MYTYCSVRCKLALLRCVDNKEGVRTKKNWKIKMPRLLYEEHLQDAAQMVWLPSGSEELDPRSMFIDRVTYCAGISWRYLAVALVTWGRALGQSTGGLGSIGHQGKKQPTAEGFIPVHPVRHTEVTSIQSDQITPSHIYHQNIGSRTCFANFEA